MKKILLFIAILLITLSGCKSKMTVYKDQDGSEKEYKETGGIPFKMTETVVKTGYRNTHSKVGSLCLPSPFIEAVALPIGKTYYVNVDMGQFADGGLTFKANSNGTVQEISMTSKPDSSAIDAFTGALGNLLPFAGILPKAAKEPDPDPSKAASSFKTATGAVIPSCDSGEANVVFLPFKTDNLYNNVKINEQIELISKMLGEIKSKPE